MLILPFGGMVRHAGRSEVTIALLHSACCPAASHVELLQGAPAAVLRSSGTVLSGNLQPDQACHVRRRFWRPA